MKHFFVVFFFSFFVGDRRTNTPIFVELRNLDRRTNTPIFCAGEKSRPHKSVFERPVALNRLSLF